ncbi:diguanylate cyclase [Paenibacillus sp. LMG 31461]|uniref:Diguanylate cyclase n=1 Tax=Paenibacillus plantarum TaxID=2654975 RepID=A0ABX1X836_9BACL|nr:GGDEF domain-containing protein [Paenibacillus plantarum]NOU64371.1 diguanylate cyclase [Paenibacillus plantarum]
MKYTGRIVLLTLSLLSWILIIVHSYSYQVYGKMDIIYLICALANIGLGWFLGKHYDIAKFYSEKDYLTQVYTRRYGLKTLSSLLQKMEQKKKELSLFVVDVDKFKQINDTYGHDTGDWVLKCIATSLVNCTRKTDIITRWGGDEFLIVAPDTNNYDLFAFLIRIENQLKEVSMILNLEISLSIGVSSYPDDALNIDELIRIADKNMYLTKIKKS